MAPPAPRDHPAQARTHRIIVGVGLLLFLALFATLLTLASNPQSAIRKLLEALLAHVRDPKFGLVYVLLAYAVGTLVFAPITLLLGATALALGPVRGFFYAMAGGLFAAAVSYWLGRWVGAAPLRKYGGKRLNSLTSHVHAKSFRSVLIARFLPVGNFTLINLFLGSTRVPFLAYMAANVVGILPSVLAFTLLSEEVHEAIHHPSVWSIGRLALAALVLIGVAFGFSRFMRKQAQPQGVRSEGP